MGHAEGLGTAGVQLKAPFQCDSRGHRATPDGKLTARGCG